MHLEWTLKAVGDLREAGHFIAEDNPPAAEKIAERVQEGVEYLFKPSEYGQTR